MLNRNQDINSYFLDAGITAHLNFFSLLFAIVTKFPQCICVTIIIRKNNSEILKIIVTFYGIHRDSSGFCK